MAEYRMEGGASQLKGALKDAAGKVLGDHNLQAEGGVDTAIGKVQDSYGHFVQQLEQVRTDIEDYTLANPWLALAAALGTGLVLGHVSGRSRRRLVYVHKIKPSQIR